MGQLDYVDSLLKRLMYFTSFLWYTGYSPYPMNWHSKLLQLFVS